MLSVGLPDDAARWTVDQEGALSPDDGGWTLHWEVLGVPRGALRQSLLDLAPVVVTRRWVEGGDVVSTHWALPDPDGHAVVAVEVQNDSPGPVALQVTLTGASRPRRRAGVVVSRRTGLLRTGRQPQTVRTTPARIVLGWALGPHEGLRLEAGPLGSAGPAHGDPAAAARGWTARVDRVTRFVLPEGRWATAFEVARRGLYLLPRERPTPIGLLAVAALAESGGMDVARRTLAEWAGLGPDPAERTGRERLARRLAELDGTGDPATGPEHVPDPPTGVPVAVADWRRVRSFLVDDSRRPSEGAPREVALFPALPDEWRTEALEVHGLPTAAGPISFALRRHGSRPALLWEAEGPVLLTAPGLDPGWSAIASGR